MATRTERESKGSTSTAGRNVIEAFLTHPENQTCADCGTKDPRWASWNLGVFICIDCAGIHRSIGTHISRVKSVDLDMWTPDQVLNMLKWGNSRANEYWLANLSGAPPTRHGMANFIKAKYERKEFIVRGVPMPNHEPINLNSTSLKVIASAVSSPTPSSSQSTSHSRSLSSGMKSSSSERIHSSVDRDSRESATKAANRKKLEQIRSNYRSNSNPDFSSSSYSDNEKVSSSNNSSSASLNTKAAPATQEPVQSSVSNSNVNANLIDIDPTTALSPSTAISTSSADLDLLSALFAGTATTTTSSTAPLMPPDATGKNGSINSSTVAAPGASSAFSFIQSPVGTPNPASSPMMGSGNSSSSSFDFLNAHSASSAIATTIATPATTSSNSVPDLISVQPKASKESILALYGKPGEGSTPASPQPTGFFGNGNSNSDNTSATNLHSLSGSTNPGIPFYVSSSPSPRPYYTSSRQ